jgi:hypothetical protein
VIPPAGERADQKQDEDDEENSSKAHNCPPVALKVSARAGRFASERQDSGCLNVDISPPR